MRLKLEEIRQEPRQTVSEFVYELQGLFNMVGAMPPEMKVVKLWYSLRTGIQRKMWQDGLHPDTSTWDEVVAKAEVIEIADNVRHPSDRKPMTMSATRNSRDSYNHAGRQRSDQAARSMTYMNR